MSEEDQFQKYLGSLPKGEVEEMSSKRKAGLPPMHQLLAEKGKPQEDEEEIGGIDEPQIPQDLPLTSPEVQERLDKLILSRQPDAVRREMRETKQQEKKEQIKKFRRIEKDGST